MPSRASAASRNGEQRPVQVVGDDDRVEALARRAATCRARDRVPRSRYLPPRRALPTRPRRDRPRARGTRDARIAGRGGRGRKRGRAHAHPPGSVREAHDPRWRARDRCATGIDGSLIAESGPREGGARHRAGLAFSLVSEPADKRDRRPGGRRHAARIRRSSRARSRSAWRTGRRAVRRAGAPRSAGRGRARRPVAPTAAWITWS